MIICDERPTDTALIRALTALAFKPMPFSNGTEPAIIDALRASGDLTLSLVALEGDDLVGQITFSPVYIDSEHDDWFGLGPVAVTPEKQNQGIGSALIKEGLNRLETKHARGCVLIGNPEYYARFGFKNHCGLTYGELDTSFIQKLPLRGPDKSGKLIYCQSFEKAAVAS
jgi:putative acetyltransferase